MEADVEWNRSKEQKGMDMRIKCRTGMGINVERNRYGDKIQNGMDMRIKCETEWNGYGDKMQNETDMKIKWGMEQIWGVKCGTGVGIKYC